MPSANSIGATSLNAPMPVNRPKSAHVNTAANGYTVLTDNTTQFGQTVHIAATIEDVNTIINDYFSQE